MVLEVKAVLYTSPLMPLKDANCRIAMSVAKGNPFETRYFTLQYRAV